MGTRTVFPTCVVGMTEPLCCLHTNGWMIFQTYDILFLRLKQQRTQMKLDCRIVALG